MSKSLQSNENNISIIWDFDKTLTSKDSTSELIKIFVSKKDLPNFWKRVKEISGVDSNHPVDSISSSEAPVWMYLLSELSKEKDENLSDNLFRFIAKKIPLYKNVEVFLKKIKALSKEQIYTRNKIKIHHFIITAGLRKLVSYIFSNTDDLITEIFGSRYKFIKKINSHIPIYCMDKTGKTRSLFEISKGCFQKNAKYTVDDLVTHDKEWCNFENMIYIGDGDTDIPAFSLIKSKKGMSIAVFDSSQKRSKREEKAKNLKTGKRIDLFTPADFKLNGELFTSIKVRCKQIAQRYDAHRTSK